MSKLKKCISEINDIMRKYDVMGAVALADGEGNGEYRFNVDEGNVTWSKVEVTSDGDLKIKMRFSSEKLATEKTVNGLFNLDLPLKGMVSNMEVIKENIRKHRIVEEF